MYCYLSCDIESETQPDTQFPRKSYCWSIQFRCPQIQPKPFFVSAFIRSRHCPACGWDEEKNTRSHRHQSAVDWRKRSKNNIIEPARTHGPIQAKEEINTQSHSDSALFLYQFIFTFYLFHCRMRSCCGSCEINNNHISLLLAIVTHSFICSHTTI